MNGDFCTSCQEMIKKKSHTHECVCDCHNGEWVD